MPSIVPYNAGESLLLPVKANKNTRDRIEPYLKWAGKDWIRPDLGAYADYCRNVNGWKETSIAAHLSTIRGQYKRLASSNEFRDYLLRSLPEEMPLDQRLLMVNEAIKRIENAIETKVQLDLITKQDDEPHVRLSKRQVQELFDDMLHKRDTGSISEAQYMRDFALIRLMLGTGIREEEAANLRVEDLYQEYEGFPALEVKRGKGAKQRMVLYGGLQEWALNPVEAWLNYAKIKDGFVFRGLKRNHEPGSRGLNKQSITNTILKRYSVTHKMQPYSPTAHDFRYTYARSLHNEGMPIEAIQRNLGHSKIETTLRYIGDISAHLRAPRNGIYSIA